jgi:outer membrane protein OmpA-like peptidoglycan-associated protein
MTKVILSSLFVSSTLLGAACSKDKKETTTPVADTQPADPSMDTASASVKVSSTSDQVFFAFDSAELTPPGKTSLDDVAMWVKANPDRTILVRGHSDKTGGADYNLDLSAKRAQAVATYLKSNGVAEGQIIIAAVGEAQSELDPEAANRRVVLFATTVESTTQQ